MTDFFLEGCTVIDIGAAMGDTAIMFILRGAKKVIGYEFQKKQFEIAEKNIKLNKMQKKVELYFCGIS